VFPIFTSPVQNVANGLAESDTGPNKVFVGKWTNPLVIFLWLGGFGVPKKALLAWGVAVVGEPISFLQKEKVPISFYQKK
jgi:hypothetical protein